jgi:hypothetical protein
MARSLRSPLVHRDLVRSVESVRLQKGTRSVVVRVWVVVVADFVVRLRPQLHVGRQALEHADSYRSPRRIQLAIRELVDEVVVLKDRAIQNDRELLAMAAHSQHSALENVKPLGSLGIGRGRFVGLKIVGQNEIGPKLLAGQTLEPSAAQTFCVD